VLVAFGAVLTVFYQVAACPLCIVQRMLYLAIAVAALSGFVFARSTPTRLCAAFAIAASSIAGAAIAVYQIYLQRNPFSATCGDGTSWWERVVDQAGQLFPALFKAEGLCSDSTWSWLGLSFVEWSLLAFTGFLLLGLLSLFVKQRPASS
jgi:disulfide bond formation protein DsbB